MNEELRYDFRRHVPSRIAPGFGFRFSVFREYMSTGVQKQTAYLALQHS